ncbi:GGDEF domain-containing protein [Imhoffiella purpurea]|uniref:GGDEF domain-containing protein n=1 Tax=Imhoffiella purpurea TaxID=1249627 RepID=UPI001E4EABE2|nr:GGDEF domain-containing protein [Imhoffiella purpurea]
MSARSLILYLLVVAACCGWSSCLAADVVDLESGWEYRWGDSPFTPEGVPLWTHDDASGRWSSIGFPSNPPGRGSQTNVWFRATLPDGSWRDPVLYVFSVDLIVEVYLEGRRIYRFGHFGAQGEGRFEGWPWHMIPLPVDCAGKRVYFRVFSDYMDIGLWGRIRVMERVDLLLGVVRSSIERLVIGGFSFLIACLSLFFGFLSRERLSFTTLALFSLASGCMVLSGSQINLLVIDRPLLWDYMGAIGYFTIPIAMAFLLDRWLRPMRAPLVGLVWRFHLFYLVGALALSWTGMVSLADTYPVFDACFAISLALLLIPAVHVAVHGNNDQKAILAAHAILSLLLLLDMAVAHGLIPWVEVPVAWGALAFSLAVVIVSLRYYACTQVALQALNLSLEQEVRRRTAALARLVSRERRRARMLEVESGKRAELERLLSDLQGCKEMEEAVSSLPQWLSAFCHPLAGAYYRLDKDAGNYRLQASWLDASRSGIPSLVPVCESAGILTVDRHWRLPLRYEDPRYGECELGVLWLRIPDERGRADSDEDTEWLSLIELGLEKIGLVLSQHCLHGELRRLSYEDGLTGIKNRRFLDDMFSREASLAARHERPLSVIMCDVDHFKRFNDTHGHAAGDRVLRRVAEILSGVFRQTDLVCRYGGEEFTVVMPGTRLEDCRQRAEELRQGIETESFEYEGCPLGSVTISVGIASWPEMAVAPEMLIVIADQALYRAKRAGRNRVESY